MPIVVLSARTAETQRLSAFENGADDYVVKPFSAPELLAQSAGGSRADMFAAICRWQSYGSGISP